MSRSRSFAALVLAAFAGLAASGCDALVQESVARQGVGELKADAAQDGDCAGCLKFKARPPSGINAPPSMP